MNSVAVATPVPSLQPAAATAVPSAAVHAAMQRSALARQANGHTNAAAPAAGGHNAQFASRAAQMQAQQANYYAPTRSRRAGSRDRAWTDSTTEKEQQQQQHQQSDMAATLRPRVVRAAAAYTSPHRQQTMNPAAAPYQFKQQQQFPTLQHHHHQQSQRLRTPPQSTQRPHGHPPHQHGHHQYGHNQYTTNNQFSHQHQQQHQYQQRASLTRAVSPAAQIQPQPQRSRPSSTRSSPASSSSTSTSSASQPQHKQPTPAPAAAAVEWRVAVDPKSKRPYYYHPVTRQTTWKKPQELVDKEKQERASFFAAMESNIRAKLRDGNWFRDSLTSRPGDLEDMALAEEEDDGELSSSTSTSSRSSWSSATTASVASATPAAHKHARVAAAATAQRSLPASPELEPKASTPSNQDDNDAASEALLLAAAAKPPVLFRTLSSYETPVVGETKKLANGRVIAVPSPILERVRLAGMDDMPRSSDLEAYTRPDVDSLLSADNISAEVAATPGSSSSAHATENSRGIARRPLRRRSNSTSTIFVRMGTMNKPDQDTTIQCVATVLRAHLMEAQAAPIQVDGKFEIFVNARDQQADAIPSLKDIGVFIKHVFSRAQMESECIIMSLIYVERLLKATMGALQLQPGNWRAILFCSMVMASKVWDDLSMCNADFSKIWPELSLKEINELELTYLGAVEYNVRVSAVSYAKYYFHLRSMCASMGMLKAFDESAPLNLDGARKMQVLSEEYQDRTKLLPAPSRRRSVTITTPSADGRAAVLAGGASGPTKWTPTASLEQLVQMQSRVAGGTSLATMHRLSTSSASSRA